MTTLRTALLGMLIVIGFASSGFTLETIPAEDISPPFGPGEVLSYNLKWTVIKGGEARMSVVANADADSLWEVHSLAWSTGIVDVFYTVRDTIISTIDRGTLLPTRFVKKQHEGKYHRDSTYVFDQAAGIIYRNGGSFACSLQVHDILSVLYRVRTYPLAVEQSYEATVYEGGKLYTAAINVLREEQVTVPAGTFDCVVAEPILQSEAIFKQKGRLWIWFTNDDRRIPVLMSSEVPVGAITAELYSYQPPVWADTTDSSHR